MKSWKAPFRREQLVYISAEIYADGISVALPVHTSSIPVVYSKQNRNILKWDEWLVLPVQYCELPRDVVLCIQLVDFSTEECLGSSTIDLFTEDGEFRSGKRDICIWPKTEPDPVYYDRLRIIKNIFFYSYFCRFLRTITVLWFFKILLVVYY